MVLDDLGTGRGYIHAKRQLAIVYTGCGLGANTKNRRVFDILFTNCVFQTTVSHTAYVPTCRTTHDVSGVAVRLRTAECGLPKTLPPRSNIVRM